MTRSHTSEEALSLCPSLNIISLPLIKQDNPKNRDLTLLNAAIQEITQILTTFPERNNLNLPKNSISINFNPTDEFYVDLTKAVAVKEDQG